MRFVDLFPWLLNAWIAWVPLCVTYWKKYRGRREITSFKQTLLPFVSLFKINYTMDIPADLKYVTPYVQRGQELITRDPVVSYYGKVYWYKHSLFSISHLPRKHTSTILCCQAGYCKGSKNQRNKWILVSFTWRFRNSKFIGRDYASRSHMTDPFFYTT